MSICCIFHSFFDTNAKVQHSIYTVFFANTKKIQNLYIFVSKYESNLIFLLHVHVFYPPNARRLVPGGVLQQIETDEGFEGWVRVRAEQGEGAAEHVRMGVMVSVRV